MKKLLFSLSFIFLNITLNAGQLSIFPELVSAGDSIILMYKNDAQTADATPLKAFVYLFSPDSSAPDACEYDLKQTANPNEYTTSFKIHKDVVFGAIKIYCRNADVLFYDNNFKKFWAFLVNENKSKPKSSANLKAALFLLGNMPENISGVIDYKKALGFLKTELDFYPDNIEAKLGYYTLLFDLKKTGKDEFNKHLNEVAVFKSPNIDENTLRVISRALKALNKADEAGKIEQDFVKLNPNSQLAEELLLEKLAGVESLKDFKNIAEQYFKNFPKSADREKIFSALVSALLQVSDYGGLSSFLKQIDNISPTVYSQLAFSLVSDNEILPDVPFKEKVEEAKKIFNSKLKEVVDYEIIDPEINIKPCYMTTTEWKESRKMMFGSYAQTGAEIYFAANETLDAIKYFKKAMDFLGAKTPQDLYEKYIDITSKAYMEKEAMDAAAEAIKNNRANSDVLLFYRTSYLKKNPDQNALLHKLDSLNNLSKKRRMAIINSEQVNIGPVSGVIKSADGKILELSDFKGKTLVIMFFSGWCGVCKAMMPAFDANCIKYKDNPEIAFIAVDLWEKESDRLNILFEFQKNKDYTFGFYADENDLLPQTVGFSGLPTIIVLDKNNIVRYIVRGFGNAMKFADDIEDAISLVK